VNAAHRAHEIGCDTFQIFSANPRGWNTRSPSAAECAGFRQVRGDYGLSPLVIHANYLINLASLDPAVRLPSIAAFRKELERALALGADYVVLHPGSAKGGERGEALRNCVESLARAAEGLDFGGLRVLLENTAGQGDVLGWNLEELAALLDGASREIPAGVCIDTAHLFAAGYAIHTARGLREAVRQLEACIGLENVRVIHANDSKTPFGSRTDRHEHIGKGAIGAEGFRGIVRHPKLRAIPFICETPVDRPNDDRMNLRAMRKLAGEAPKLGNRRQKASSAGERP